MDEGVDVDVDVEVLQDHHVDDGQFVHWLVEILAKRVDCIELNQKQKSY